MIVSIRKSAHLISSTLLVSILSFVILLPSHTQALSGNDFQAGRIIDDDIFFNSATMVPSQIQAFLNAKVPVCDTNGSQPYGGDTRAAYGASRGYPPPYTCLKEYIQNTPTMGAEAGLCNQYNGGIKSAAEIIYEVGKSCGINPQVLIVLLQKEQSLVTDDWPWGNQYAKATGFGCPDTAPCDPAFGGFFYQVFYAARQFKNYAKNPNNYGYRAYRNNNILYNPNTACGSSTVYLQNQATAGLYVYTPYRPNQAALDNLYETGDGCSAYGNRNFWRLFNDWFGSTIIGQRLSVVYKGQNGTELYAVWDGKKYYIPSWDIMIAWGLHRQNVNVVSDQTIANLTTDSSLSNIAKMSDDPNSPLYLFDDGKRYPIPGNACGFNLDGSPNPTTTWGLDCFNTNVSKSFPKAFIENATAHDITLPPMMAYQNSVWKLEGGKKRRIVDGLIVDVLGGWNNVRWMKDSNALQPEGKIIMRNGYPVRFSNSPVVYLYDNGQLNTVASLDTFVNWGMHKGLTDLPASYNAPDPLPMGGQLTQIAKEGDSFYVVDKGYKLPLANDTAQWPTDSALTIPGMLSGMPAIPLSNVYLSDGSGQIFTVYGKKRFVFPTMDDFFRLGFNPAAIRRLSGSVENLPGFSYGGMHMSNGRLYKVNDNPHQIYRVNGSNSQTVNSINYPGLEYDKLITVDPLTASRYPVNGSYNP